MINITRQTALLLAIACSLSISVLAEDAAAPTIIACVGDSITFGARLENRATDSYPAKLQELLGKDYKVKNFGVGSCTLIRKGKPNVWSQLNKIKSANPDIIIIILGTNDTCGGRRKCWDHKDEFPKDYRDLIDSFRAFPSKPVIWICSPTPMVLKTPGLSAERTRDLRERQPRLQAFIGVIKEVAEEKAVGFIDLNTPLAAKPELFTEKDGVHPNKDGYQAIAKLVHAELVRSATDTKAQANKAIDSGED